jgi:putative transposase/integrase-like protein
MNPSTTPATTPLRQRMIDDMRMRMRKLDGKTQTSYIRAVRKLAAFLGRPPDTASVEDLRRFQPFRWKDYRAKGRTRYKAMTLGADEFMRRFLLHVLPAGLHRIRHYGLLANGARQANLARARQLLLEPGDAHAQAHSTPRPALRNRASSARTVAVRDDHPRDLRAWPLDPRATSRPRSMRAIIRRSPNPPSALHRRGPTCARYCFARSNPASGSTRDGSTHPSRSRTGSPIDTACQRLGTRCHRRRDAIAQFAIGL